MTAELIIASVFTVCTVLIFVRRFDSPDLSRVFKKSPAGNKAQSSGEKKMCYESKNK